MTHTPRSWYRFQNATETPSVADIYIVDLIGSWYDEFWRSYYGDSVVTAKSFLAELAKLEDSVKTIRVHINSPGGDVFAAINIANALREQASKGRVVETIVDGLAASAASIVLMAGTKVCMADNALVMVHNPWTVGIGNAKDMRKCADELDTVRNAIAATYKWHSTLSDDEIFALMDAETWMDADEAIAKGFATEKVEGLKAAASIDRRAAAKLSVPDKHRARVDALLTPADDVADQKGLAAEIMNECATAGLDDLVFAKSLIDAKCTIADARGRITAEKSARAIAQRRSEDITAACTLAKHPELSAGYVAGAMSVADVKTQLTIVNAKIDAARGNVDPSLSPDAGAGAVKSTTTLDPAAIYEARKPKKEQ